MEAREIRKDELDRLLEFYKLHLYDVSDEPWADPAVVDEIWNTIQESNNFAILGVFHNDTLMASCSITIVPNITRGGRPYALIENIATHRRHRREGYGSMVLTFATEYAGERGCYKAMFMTGHLNEKVEKFCNATGYVSGQKKAYIKRWEY